MLNTNISSYIVAFNHHTFLLKKKSFMENYSLYHVYLLNRINI